MTTHTRILSRTTAALIIVLLFLLPILYAVMIALETPQHFLDNPLVPPTHLDFSNFSQAWSQADLGRELLNTILYSVVASGLSTVLALLIAFPISRKLVRGASAVYGFLVAGLFLPLAIIPLFIEAVDLHLYDSRIGYILLHVEPGMPLGVVVITAFLSAVPPELDEAAWMEGASYLRYLRKVVAPLARPALLITFLYGMLGVWNDIIGPVVFLSKSSLFPVTRGVYNFYGSNQSEWTLLAAAIILASLPIVALFVVSQRQLIQSAVAGSVKG